MKHFFSSLLFIQSDSKILRFVTCGKNRCSRGEMNANLIDKRPTLERHHESATQDETGK